MSNLYFSRGQHIVIDENIVLDGNGHGWFSSHKWKISHYATEELERLGYREVAAINQQYAEYFCLYNCNCGAKKVQKRVMPVG